MQKDYDRDNLFFSFPESWALDDQNAPESVSVLGPDGSFWCVRRELPDTPSENAIAQAVDAMREEYPDLEVESISDTIDGVPLTGVDLHFFCFDLTGTASIRIWPRDDCKLVIFTQAEDNQLDRVQPAFTAITASLIREK